jgi:D-glycero-D-manno-heptose 1,7-bisphosphate phosphatase
MGTLGRVPKPPRDGAAAAKPPPPHATGDSLKPAVFLDRDGVIVRDVDLLVRADQIELMPGAAAAIARLGAAGLPVVVVSNQPVVARGLVTEDQVRALEAEIERRLAAAGASVDGFYYCPHHPRATLPAYRDACECRKPRPGLLLRAARELELDLAASTMVGDRPSDVAAGRRAGCRTILVETGMHAAAPIESPDSFADARPDAVVADLAAAAGLILGPRA